MYRAIFSMIRFFRLAVVERDMDNSSDTSIKAQPRRRNGITSSSSSVNPQFCKNNSHSSLKNFTDHFPPEKQNNTTNNNDSKTETRTTFIVL